MTGLQAAPGAEAAPAVATATGTVSGMVTDSETGAPVKGAQVTDPDTSEAPAITGRTVATH
ncbi:MAG: hypothetical protein LWW86_15405 [Micrococcales bacterium]|nr:hypothetical protein [Micrococcales bacterium]